MKTKNTYPKPDQVTIPHVRPLTTTASLSQEKRATHYEPSLTFKRESFSRSSTISYPPKVLPKYRDEPLDPDQEPPIQSSFEEDPEMEVLRLYHWNSTKLHELNPEVKSDFIKYLMKYADYEKNNNMANAKIAFTMINDLQLNDKKEEQEKQDQEDEKHVMERLQKRYDDLHKRQENEINEFEEKWSKKYSYRYKKASPYYLNMSYQKQRMDYINQMNEAKETEKRMAKQREIETKISRAKFAEDYDNARKQLDQRHKQERGMLNKEKKIQLDILRSKKMLRDQNYSHRDATLDYKTQHFLGRKPSPAAKEVVYYQRLVPQSDLYPILLNVKSPVPQIKSEKSKEEARQSASKKKSKNENARASSMHSNKKSNDYIGAVSHPPIPYLKMPPNLSNYRSSTSDNKKN